MRRKNQPCGWFFRVVLAEAMFRQQAKPRGGVAEFSSEGEKISVTTNKSFVTDPAEVHKFLIVSPNVDCFSVIRGASCAYA